MKLKMSSICTVFSLHFKVQVVNPEEKKNDTNVVGLLTSDNILLGVEGDHAQILRVEPGEAVDQVGAGEGI
jgi:hypothetical protein